MNENEQEIINSQENDTETTDNNEEIEIELEEDTETDDVEALKKKVATLEAQKNHWKTKATKPAEKPATQPESKPSSIASRDLIALMNAKVHEDDISEVEDYAKFRGISIAEALKSGVVKTLLQEKAQQRNVALATNTGSTRAPSRKLSDDVLLSNASKGSMPEDVDSLVAARFKAKRQK